MPSKRWKVAPPAPDDYIAGLSPHHRILAQVLYNRGFADPDAARKFIDGADELASPLTMKDIGKATGRIKKAIWAKEPIVVYGDFDVDGVTATALLTLSLRRLGANVTPYIPNRMDEGYGLNSDALRKLAGDGAKLVITVDCGIRSVKETADAKAAGLEMIITDHHSIGADGIKPFRRLAYAVINPKREDSSFPFRDLSGVGVTYALVRALFHAFKLPPQEAEQYLDLVALGTVADLVPLTGENRALVIRGLEALREAKRPGVRALMNVAGVEPRACDAFSIGFMLGPRLNAAGRLETATLALDLLTTDDEARAAALAGRLNEINRERQEKTAAMQAIAAEKAGIRDGEPPPSLIFAAAPEFHQGIVGLVASRLTEQFYRPSVVVQLGEAESHGSCRSIREFHITHALDQCADLLVRHGGHAAAAGFTVRNENVEALRARLREIAEAQLGGQDLTPTLAIDAWADLSELSLALIEELARLEPTGMENPRPVLATRRVRVDDARRVGRDENHLAFRVRDGKSLPLSAIAFRMGDRLDAITGRIVDIAYYPQINEWNGLRSVQLVVSDVQPTEENLL